MGGLSTKSSTKAVLLSFLDKEQQACLEQHGHFFVLGPTGDVYGVSPRAVAMMKDGRVFRYRNVWPVDRRESRLDAYESMLYLSVIARTDPGRLWGYGCGDPPTPLLYAGCPPMKRTKLA